MSSLRMGPLERPVEGLAEVRGRARARILQVGTTFSVLLALAGVRGILLCVWPSEATRQQLAVTRSVRYEVEGRRGDVLDRNGNRLATTVPTPDIVINPKHVHEIAEAKRYDLDQAAARIAEILGRADAAPIAAMMRRPANDQYELVAAAVDVGVAAEIARLKLVGVEIDWNARRYYPEQTVAGQLVGYLDEAGVGAEGLEKSFEAELRGDQFVMRRRESPGASVQEAARGGDVTLTIDRSIQRMAERALDQIVDQYAPLAAAAVVVDVRTGEMLALANAPSYNPNRPLKASEIGRRRNWAIEASIEPGSVLKPFVVAAAIEEQVVTPDQVIDCTAVPGLPTINDHGAFGPLSVTDVVARSSNVGAARIALALGGERFAQYMRAFGFGEPLGLRVPRSADGAIDEGASLRGIRLANNGFGQGLSVSPVQLAYALAALGNGGRRMRPELVARVEDVHGVADYLRHPRPVAQAVSGSTAAQVMTMMEAVFAERGTGQHLRVPGYRAAGKSGTAQKATGPDGYGDEYIVSFMGLVPAEDPRVAIVVSVDAPQGLASPTGAGVAGPAFVSIAAEALPYLGVAPDPALLPSKPVAEPLVAELSPIRLAWRDGGWLVPDLRGRPLRTVLDALAPSGLAVSAAGSGVVTAQAPLPGALLRVGQEIALTLD